MVYGVHISIMSKALYYVALNISEYLCTFRGLWTHKKKHV